MCRVPSGQSSPWLPIFCRSASFVPLSPTPYSAVTLQKLISRPFDAFICSSYFQMFWESHILQALFPHYVSQKFQLQFSDPTQKFSFPYHLFHYSHVPSMVSSSSFFISTPMLPFLLFNCEETIQPSLPYKRVDMIQQFSTLLNRLFNFCLTSFAIPLWLCISESHFPLSLERKKLFKKIVKCEFLLKAKIFSDCVCMRIRP